ncbi:methyltransferase domain-containing protein [Rhodoferax sp. GW822-FHT02A01]|uniref:class I SAM-dependent methyltransferase n=1 Tax=Rhodoferax sp. GW822-FHT02A01 TaxID=3141537 RepID=UPI00315D2354
MSVWSGWIVRRIESWFSSFQRRHDLLPVVTAVAPNDGNKLLLHVGCGHATLAHIPVEGFHREGWKELRLDADATVHPDIEATMTHMVSVGSGFADAVYSSHGLEHLYWHDVPKALAEFWRVLRDDGFAVITCPDVQAAAAMIAQDRMFEPAYESPSGTITPFDILYSYRPFVEQNPQWMSHHCGFTLSTLTQVLREAGFPMVAGFRRPGAFDLWVLASKSQRSEGEMRTLAKDYLVSI